MLKMVSRVLCEEPTKIVLAGAGDMVEFAIGEPPLRFSAEASSVESIFVGLPVQLSDAQGYCRLEVMDDAVKIDHARKGSAARSCFVAGEHLATALEWLRIST